MVLMPHRIRRVNVLVWREVNRWISGLPVWWLNRFHDWRTKSNSHSVRACGRRNPSRVPNPTNNWGVAYSITRFINTIGKVTNALGRVTSNEWVNFLSVRTCASIQSLPRSHAGIGYRTIPSKFSRSWSSNCRSRPKSSSCARTSEGSSTTIKPHNDWVKRLSDRYRIPRSSICFRRFLGGSWSVRGATTARGVRSKGDNFGGGMRFSIAYHISIRPNR